jgi:hypothetical protein
VTQDATPEEVALFRKMVTDRQEINVVAIRGQSKSEVRFELDGSANTGRVFGYFNTERSSHI